MDDRYFNEVALSGIIYSIFGCNNGNIGIGLKCKRNSRVDSKNIVYISLRINQNLYNIYKDFFVKEKRIFIRGYLNSYSDENKILNYIIVTEIYDNVNDFLNGKVGTHIRYDPDGMMVWNGKRCESEIATEEEQEEIKQILKEYE